jgi:hypothetical protein
VRNKENEMKKKKKRRCNKKKMKKKNKKEKKKKKEQGKQKVKEKRRRGRRLDCPPIYLPLASFWSTFPRCNALRKAPRHYRARPRMQKRDPAAIRTSLFAPPPFSHYPTPPHTPHFAPILSSWRVQRLEEKTQEGLKASACPPSADALFQELDEKRERKIIVDEEHIFKQVFWYSPYLRKRVRISIWVQTYTFVWKEKDK